MVEEDTGSIIKNAEDMLITAKYGLDLLKTENPYYLPTGIRNVLTFGRAITKVLQRLRSHESEFSAWYKPYRDEMENDPLLKYLYRIRNDVLKEGMMPVTSKTHISFLNLDWVNQLPKPPNTKGFFIGDNLGGSGFEVELPDGSTEKLYIKLPWDTVITSAHFKNLPNSHLGKSINGISIKEICELYLQYLEKIIKGAKRKFLS